MQRLLPNASTDSSFSVTDNAQAAIVDMTELRRSAHSAFVLTDSWAYTLLLCSALPPDN